MSGSTEHEIGIVHYPGAQVACILGLTDLLSIACTIALDQRRSGQTALRVTHWKPIDASDANLSCIYDSAPRDSPQPRTLIISPTMVDPDPDKSRFSQRRCDHTILALSEISALGTNLIVVK